MIVRQFLTLVTLLALAFLSAALAESTESAWAALQAEIDSAESGAFITLTSNVTAGADDMVLIIPERKSVILDLAGYTIDRGLTEDEDADRSARPQENGNVITVNGELTVKDSSAEKIGKSPAAIISATAVA